MAITTLAFSKRLTLTLNASNTLTGSDYSATGNNTTISKSLSIATTAANAAAGGGDQLYSAVSSIAATATATIDLTSLTNFLSTTSQAFARVKSITIRVLSATDDTSIGTAATPLLIDNIVANSLSSQSSAGWFANAAEGAAGGSRFHLSNGSYLDWGTPTAAGLVVDATHKLITLTNSDAAVTMKVQVTVCGGST